MAVRASTQTTADSTIPALDPQGQHAGKPSMPLGRPFTLVGSRHRAHLHLLSRSVSKSHAILINDHGTIYIRDTASREHVIVNGEQVKESELRDGDLVKIGSFTFKMSGGEKENRRSRRAPEAALEMQDSSLPHLFDGRTLLIGRRPTCDVVLGEMAVSSVHGIIFELDGQHYIRDLGSRTGIFINGEQVHQQLLKFNDQIRIGEHEMRFSAAEPATSLDELEHLIGTATLGDEQQELAGADAREAALAPAPAPVSDPDTIPLAPEEDLIPLDLEPQPPAAPGRKPVEEIPDLAELDLNSEPDITGADDTRPLPAELMTEKPPTPGISPRVVDPGADEVGVESQERHLLVGGDLDEERLTASGSFANVAHDDDDEPVIDEMAELGKLDLLSQEPHESDAVDAIDEAPAGAENTAELPHVEHDAAESHPHDEDPAAAPFPDAITASSHEELEPLPADQESVLQDIVKDAPANMDPADLEAIAWLDNPMPESNDLWATQTAAAPSDSESGSGKNPERSAQPTEILDITEPTPESAQDLESQIGSAWPQNDTELELLPAPDELGDTQLGVAIHDFAGSALGSLVEQSQASERAITAHESIAGHPEPQSAAPQPTETQNPEWTVAPHSAFDQVQTVADSSNVAQPAEAPIVNLEDILAHEGLLESSGDEVVDQAIAFLDHERDLPESAAAPDLTIPDSTIANSMIADSGTLASPGADLLPEPHVVVEQQGSDGEPGLEFNDLSLEEAFAPIGVDATATAQTAFTTVHDATGLDELAVEVVSPAENAPPAVAEQDVELTLPTHLELLPSEESQLLDVDATERLADFDALWMDDAAPQPAAEQESADQVEEVVAPAAPTDEIFSESIAPPEAPAAAPAAPESRSAQPAQRPDPLAGMSRDFGSFLGGVPLPLQAPTSSSPPVMRQPRQQRPAPPRAAKPRPAPLFSEAPVSLNLGTTQMPPMQISPLPPAPNQPALQQQPTMEAAEETGETGSGLQFDDDEGIEEIAPGHEMDPEGEEIEQIEPGLEFEPESDGIEEPQELAVLEAPLEVQAPPVELAPEDALLDQAFEQLSPTEAGASAPALTDDEPPPELFDSNPDLLDAMPETMEPISDVTQAVGESSPIGDEGELAEMPHWDVEGVSEPHQADGGDSEIQSVPPAVQIAPPRSGPAKPAPVSKAPQFPAPAPVAKGAARKQQPPAAPPSKPLEPEAPVKPKRPAVIPPPPARSSARLQRPVVGLFPPVDPYDNPLIPPADAFANNAGGSSAFEAPEIPPTGFVPPGSAPRRTRSTSGGRPPTARKELPGPRNPMTVRKAGSPEISDQVPAPLEPLPAETLPSEAQSTDIASHDDANPLPYAPGQKKPKKRWRFPFFGLLVLLVLAGAGAGGVWYGLGMLMRPDVKAALRFEHLDQLNTQQKYREFEVGQSQRINAEDFLKFAQAIYENELHGHAGDGFLYPQANSDVDFAGIAKDVKFDADRIVFQQQKSRDPQGDRKRFAAVLKALYTQDKDLIDLAAKNRTALDAARLDLTAHEAAIAGLQNTLDEEQKKKAAFELATQKEKDISDRSAALEKTWNQAAAATRQLKTEIDAMAAAAMASPSAPPPSPDDDAQIKQMSDRLKQLNDSLATARATSGATPVETPLAGFQKAIDAARSAPGADEAPLGDYLATAQKVRDTIAQMDADLAERKKASEQAIADLNRAIAEKVDAHLKAVWAADADLKNLQQELDIQQHQLGAATSAGLTDQAATISTKVEEARKKVEARRNELASAAALPDEIKSMQKLADDEVSQMRGEQSRVGARVVEQLNLLRNTEVKSELLTGAQRSAFEQIGDRATAVSLAHRPLGDGADGDRRVLAARAADLQGQIDTRKRELSEAIKSALPAPDPAILAQKRFAAETARQAEARALDDWTTSKNELIAAQAAVDGLHYTFPDLPGETRQLAAAKAEAEALKNTISADEAYVPIIPRDPDREDLISISAGKLPDYRIPLIGAIGAITALLATLLIVRSRRSLGNGNRGRRGSLDELPTPFPGGRATAA